MRVTNYGEGEVSQISPCAFLIVLLAVSTAAAGGWHEIRITMTGEHIECFYDGRSFLEAEDGTFAEAGQVGLWTKADAVTAFDNLEVTAAGGKSDE